MTSLRSHSGRVAPAKGATWPSPRVQAEHVRHHAHVAHAWREQHGGIVRVAEVGRRVESDSVSRYRRIRIRVSERRLVRQDEDVAETGELLDNRCNVSIADQDVLVFFFHQLVAIRNHDFNHVLAGTQRNAVGGIRRIRHVLEQVASVVNGGLHLVPVVEAVIATRRAARQSGEAVGIEGIRGHLAGAAHAVGRVVPTAGQGRLDEMQQRSAISGLTSFLVQIHGDARNARRPRVLDQQRWVVERTSGCVHDHAQDAAGFPRRVGGFAPVNHLRLADEALQAVAERRRRVGALRVAAVRIFQSQNSGIRSTRLDRAATVHHHVVGCRLEAGGISLNDEPVEQWKQFIEGCVTARVREQRVRDAAVAEANRHRNLRMPGPLPGLWSPLSWYALISTRVNQLNTGMSPIERCRHRGSHPAPPAWCS